MATNANPRAHRPTWQRLLWAFVCGFAVYLIGGAVVERVWEIATKSGTLFPLIGYPALIAGIAVAVFTYRRH
jgi:hypothetical protein